ncbi:helix-turn-helix domain-containing protein [Streptomyces sp. NPDC059008]|uniref:helix-turn-helix domain-containing protein n=1 Tax=Streptomyces sp. NPDC059008 TaxID=3346693 RepID=UPI00368582C8
MLTVVASDPQTLTVPEVMTALRLSRSKVYDLIRSGTLPSFTEGRARRIPLDALRTYIHNKLEEAA